MHITAVPLHSDQWIDFISSHAEASIFHHPNWVEFLAACYGFRPHLLAALNQDESIRVGLPLLEVSGGLSGKRAVGLPFSDFCSPLAADETALNEFVEALQPWRREKHLREVQIRGPLPMQAGVFSTDSFFRHQTALMADPNQVLRRFSRNQVQRHIRQAEKLGVVVRRGMSWEDTRLFYGLHLRTRRRLGVPVQPYRFFRLLWEKLIAKGLGFVLLSYEGERLLAGGLFLHFNQTITYKFGASDPDSWKLRPNDLLFWHAIRWGCENGFQVFDWGRTDLDNDGLRNFKLGWGSTEQLVHYETLSDNPRASKPGNASTKRLLRAVIQRSPLWVCRLIGELFYVYSA